MSIEARQGDPTSPPTPGMDHYQVLGINRGATPEEVKLAHKRAAAKFHPDRQGGNHEAMSQVNEAYRVLSDPEIRERYDKTGSAKAPNSIEEKAQDLALSIISHYISEEECEDLLKYCLGAITELELKVKGEKTKLQSKIKTLEKRRKKIKYKGNGTNLILGVLEQQLSDFTKKRDEIERVLESAKLCRKLFQDYESEEKESVRQVDPFFSLMGMAGQMQGRKRPGSWPGT